MSVLSIIRKMQEKDKEIRLLILGLDNAGKTTILQRFLDQSIDQISPTVGFNIKTIQYTPLSSIQQQYDDGGYENGNCRSGSGSSRDSKSGQDQSHSVVKTQENDQNTTKNIGNRHNQEYTLSIWDIGGQSTIRSFWSNYFSHTDGLIWVIDSTDISRFDLCINTLRQVLKQERLSGVSLLILANKQDVQFAYSLGQIAELLGLTPTVAPINNGGDDGTDSIVKSDNVKRLSCAKNDVNNEKNNLSNQNNNHQNEKNNNFNNNETINNEKEKEESAPIGSILSHHWFLHGCSARANIGIKEAFDILIRDIINRLYLLEE